MLIHMNELTYYFIISTETYGHYRTERGGAIINNTRRRVMMITIFFIYLFTVLWYTVFKRDLAINNAQFELFWSYKKWFAGNKDLGREIMANIAMFIPFGYLLSSILTLFLSGKRRALIVIGSAILFSFTIETLQMFLMRGLFEWDDVFSNTAGGTLGILLFQILNRWKYLPQAMSLVFSVTCLAVVIICHNDDGVEVDNTSRMYCFQVDCSSYANGEMELTGFAFRYELEAQQPEIILRSTETGKRIKLETKQKRRPDVNKYFLCEHDYTDSGFKATGRVEDQEYEILIRWPWSVALSTGVYIDSNGVHHVAENEYAAPDVRNAPGLKDIVENGTLRVYRPDYHCSVYQSGNSVYWIVDQDFFFEEDGTTYIQYQLYTTQRGRLPQKRIEDGCSWDNIGGYFEKYELKGDFGLYRVMKRELPKEYSITSIVTGYYKNGKWIWKNYFRPIYNFSSYSPEEGDEP